MEQPRVRWHRKIKAPRARDALSWTPKVCIMAIIRDLGLLVYILLGFRFGSYQIKMQIAAKAPAAMRVLCVVGPPQKGHNLAKRLRRVTTWRRDTPARL